MNDYTPWERVLICLTNLFGNFWFGLIKGEKTYPDESTSAFVWRTKKLSWIVVIDWLMRDEQHCFDAYVHGSDGRQNAPEYRAKFDNESA